MLAKLIENELLAKHTSWRIGGPARYYLEATSADELCAGIAWGRERNLPLFLLGGGTNLLARDSGFPGLVLRYRAQEWRIDEQGADGRLYVAAGAPMAGTVRRVGGQGWGGLEWAEGLPGTIGGAIYGNAGCYGGDIAGGLTRAWLLVNGAVEEWSVERFDFGYRRSILKSTAHQAVNAGQSPLPPVVLAAELRLTRTDPDELAATMARIAAERKTRTPWGRSCGSVFKNPPHLPGASSVPSAGQLIDQAGLKGTRVGAVEISRKHGNYIVNLGGATSDELLRLIDQVRATVLQQFGVELELEVQIL
ncbi:MAG: UDP-N-acetylmuramate dehydrogenase [Chloroflexaceae bacterium]